MFFVFDRKEKHFTCTRNQECANKYFHINTQFPSYICCGTRIYFFSLFSMNKKIHIMSPVLSTLSTEKTYRREHGRFFYHVRIPEHVQQWLQISSTFSFLVQIESRHQHTREGKQAIRAFCSAKLIIRLARMFSQRPNKYTDQRCSTVSRHPFPYHHRHDCGTKNTQFRWKKAFKNNAPFDVRREPSKVGWIVRIRTTRMRRIRSD